MAKHAKKASRKSGRKTSRRRGSSKIDFTSIALAVGGAIVAAKLQTAMAKDPTKTTLVNLSPYAGMAAGIGAMMFVKNPTIQALAFGMTVQGGISVLKKLSPGLVGNFAMIPVISATSNRYRNLPEPVMNGVNKVGYPLPNTSVYKDSMSVINGVNSANPSGSGAASPYN